MHTSGFFVLDLNCQIWITNKGLSEKINAMPDVWRGDHHWQGFMLQIQLLARGCQIEYCPETCP